MGVTYLNLICGQLGLPCIHEPLEWAFEDGNQRYIQPLEHLLTLELKKPHGDDDDIDGWPMQGPFLSSKL